MKSWFMFESISTAAIRGAGFRRFHAAILAVCLAGICRASSPDPEVLVDDPRVRVTFSPPSEIIHDGLQPFLTITRTGALIVQSQLSAKSFPSSRMAYHSLLATSISRDGGATWQSIPLKPGDNGLNMEGGAVQLRDGTILALDTFVTPGPRAGTGVGQLYVSHDDWRTLEGPIEVSFDLPGIDYSRSSDDSGKVHAAARLHRRILELPNGDLLTTLYGWFDGDDEPAAYMPTMKRSRVVLLRSRDRGRHWTLASTIASGRKVGTEGYNEPVIARISSGPNSGRLICQMRTGREQREAVSDDDGRSWSEPRTRVYADLDVYRTEKWRDMFLGVKDRSGREIVGNPVEMIGAVVDPDLIELRSGLLVASFGVRVPPRACWPRAEHPWNGNYLAVSLDHGETWSHVVRMTSGILTTQYTAIGEMPGENQIYFAYDLGDWNSGRGRSTFGRRLTIHIHGSVAGPPPGTPLAVKAAAGNAFDTLMHQLVASSDLGTNYVLDSLKGRARREVPLQIQTVLSDPSHCGPREHGWAVDGGNVDAYTHATARRIPVPGNRSVLAKLSFRSTQEGVLAGEHGLVELRLCRGTTSENLPLRIRIENGAFYILGLNGEEVLAGSRLMPVFTMQKGAAYTVKVLLFEKGIYARLSGGDIPGLGLDLVIPDRYRFIPGLPGFGLAANPRAEGGDLAVFDWSVSPVGPSGPCLLAAIGDSITAGLDRDPEAESYVYLVTRALGQTRVLNVGSGGSTTTLDAARFPYEVAPFKPSLVWIEGGTNDIAAGLSAERIFSNLEREAALIDWGGQAVFSTVPPRTLPNEAQYVELERLNELIRSSGRPFVDRHRIVCDPSNPRQIAPAYRMPDGIHLTPAAAVLIADSATRIMRAALESGPAAR
ncbi:MAG: hypothetical protein HS122_16110 [Opitutaceae bacterium]|nr:hypothetical protein [Opitutaceae bacterium]